MMHQLLRSSPVRLAVVAFSLFFSVSLLSRVLLLIAARNDVSWDASLLGVFGCGVFFDLVSGLFAALPWLLLGVFVTPRFLKSKAGGIILMSLMTIFAGALVFITVAEWVFWDEFGARFNFIAVDYLIWTQEVLGNMFESYPMIPILTGIVIAGASVAWLMKRKGVFAWAAQGAASWLERCAAAATGLALAALIFFTVSQSAIPAFTNQFHDELAKNGCWSFMAAFKQMELEYTKWYPKLPKDEAFAIAKKQLVTPNETATTTAPNDLRRTITPTGPERRWNIMFICMESFGADYMTYGGNKHNISPNLDRLTTESIFFENLYATGTRTVRGMEAITLNLPPTPGQAIIYRPEGTNLVTTFSPFLERGYDCAFFYGGDGRFDFMNRYFGTNGCRVADVGTWKKEEITYKTSWGACDEDLFNKALADADRNHAVGKPFNFFCMTTSNHRPYAYPEGRIDIPSHTGHKGAAKYADWSVQYLIDQASKRPWFKDTLFIFCADHCASSAGKAELNVKKFRIPAMIYNPLLVKPQKITALSSQIDVMPTVFGLLNWKHDTLGYGYDRLAPNAADLPQRAFISNYQKIGLLRDGSLAILKPKAQISLYDCDLKTGVLTPMNAGSGTELLKDTTAFYQTASWLFSTGRLKKTYQHANVPDSESPVPTP